MEVEQTAFADYRWSSGGKRGFKCNTKGLWPAVEGHRHHQLRRESQEEKLWSKIRSMAGGIFSLQ